MSIADFSLQPSPAAEPLPRRLRVGVVLDTLAIPKWMHDILTAIQRSQIAELVTIVKTDRRDEKTVSSDASFSLLFKLWQRLDRKFYRPRSMCPQCFEVLPFTPARQHVEVFECRALKRDKQRVLHPDDLGALKRKQLDLLIQLSGSLNSRELGNIAPFGIWSFEDCAELNIELFWAMLTNQLTIDSGIDIRTMAGQSQRLNRARVAIDPASLFRNSTSLCAKRSVMIDKTLRDAHEGHWSSVLDSLQSRKDVHRNPGSFDTARLVTKVLFRAVSQQVRNHLFREQWFIAFTAKHGGTNAKRELTLMRAPYDRFYADRFIIDRGGKSYIFFEDYSFSKGKGIISFVELDPEKGCSAPEPVLEEPYHLSYPCLFEWQGETYLLPETKDKRTVQLYRAIEFPRKWQLEHVLLEDVAAVDSTLLRHQEKFWLFTSGIGTSDPWFDGSSELSLFYADSLLGPWISHPGNPVVCDVRRSRQAGHIYSTGGQLIRPGQDYSAADGYGVTLNLIDTLSPSEYHETPVAYISPGWMNGNLGTHTLNRSERYEVVDGRTLMSPLSRFRSRTFFQNVELTRPLIEPI